MATERNDNQLGGRYLIQDQDHMSGVSHGNGKSGHGVSRRTDNTSGGKQRSKRQRSAGR